MLALLGMALPSLLILAAVRRWFDPVPWRIGGLFFLLALLTIGRGVFTSDMPVPLDEVMRGYPYRGIFGNVTSRNPDANDTVKQMLPWMQVVREEIAHRRVPLWNRYSFSGYPLLANAQSAPLSPFFLLTLFVPLPKQLVAMAGLKLFVSLLFAFLVIRREGSAVAAGFGAVVYSLSIFQNVYLYYPLSSVTALLPAVCYAIVRVLDDRRWRSFVFLAIAVASTLVAGHPESAAHVAVAGVLLVAVEWIAPVRQFHRRRLPVMIAAAIAGFCLAAPAVIPIVQQVSQSQRLAAVGGGVRAAMTYPSTVLWLIVNPDGLGNPALGNWRWYMNYIMVAPSYIGLIPLTLLPLALVPAARRRDRLLLVVVVLTFLMAMNWTLFGRGLNLLPPFSIMANDRLRFVTLFFVAVLGARVVDRIGAFRSPLVLFGPVAALALGIYVFVRQFGVTLSPISSVGLVALIVFWGAWLARANGTVMATAALLGTTVELMVFNWPFNAMVPGKYYEPRLPIVEALHRMEPEEPFRIVGADWVFLPNASAQYGLEDIRGSDPMAWAPYTEFFRLIQAPGQDLDVGRVIDVMHPAVRFLNVEFLLAEPRSDFPPPWRRVYRGIDGDLYRNERPLSRFFAPETLIGDPSRLPAIDDFTKQVVVGGLPTGAVRHNGHITGMWLREINPQRFRMAIDAAGPTFMASSEPAAPGWVVKVNHRRVPIIRVNGAFIGFELPAGTSRVSVEYRPDTFRGGAVLSLLALTVMIAIPIGGRARRLARRSPLNGEKAD